MHALDLAPVRSALESAVLRWTVYWHDSVTSTMDVARALRAPEKGEALAVVADEQTAGRGRHGRAWVSPPGLNLYFTVALRPDPAALRRMAMIAPLAVAEGIEARTGLNASIKWPNDIQIRRLKCSGVLIDTELRGDHFSRALVGIGIDVNFDAAGLGELAGLATSLRSELGHEVERAPLLASVLLALDRRYAEAASGGDVRAAWRLRLNTIGEPVRILGPARDGTVRSEETGTVEDVDGDGGLLLRRDDGTLVTITAGEVSLRPRFPTSLPVSTMGAPRELRSQN